MSSSDIDRQHPIHIDHTRNATFYMRCRDNEAAISGFTVSFSPVQKAHIPTVRYTTVANQWQHLHLHPIEPLQTKTNDFFSFLLTSPFFPQPSIFIASLIHQLFAASPLWFSLSPLKASLNSSRKWTIWLKAKHQKCASSSFCPFCHVNEGKTSSERSVFHNILPYSHFLQCKLL